MKFLNKIVFINSAHVPYGEIGLEGNVHLTGTQGVGKSTLLRAILFFYTADKTRLGIPQGKKGFDEYYFSHPNSYIVYNVDRDEGAYTILAFKHQGRVAFRFINAPFSKEWIIDENGKALSEFPQIRERIGKKYEISNIIQSYDTYKNIIFGNNKSHDMTEFKKYALTESTKYQNIPRTIQNVFLNTKLDAEFIKTTIIKSMQEEESSIDLDYFRSQVAGFEEQYNDVKRWYTPDKNGRIRVKQQAEDVTNIFTQYTVNQREALDVFRELQFSKKSYEETLPKTKTERANFLVCKQNLESEKKEKDAAYEAKKNELNKALGAIEQKLKEIQEKKRHYAEIKIDEIIKHVQFGVHLQAEYEQLNNTYNTLTNKHQDIVNKYQNLISRLDLSVKDFEQKENEKIARKRDDNYNLTKKLFEKAELKFNEFRSESLNKTNEIDNQINANKQIVFEKKLCINSLNRECPYNAEYKDIEDKLKNLQEEENQHKESSYKLKHEHDKTIQECENEIRTICIERDKKINELSIQKENAVKEIKSLEEKITNYKGSFAEWLTINKTDWTDNIGKIINEDTLYIQNLNPQIINSDTNSLYGVQIDLSIVSSHSRSIEELSNTIKDKKRVLKEIENTIQNVQGEYDIKCDKIRKSYNDKISGLTQKINLCTIELNSVEPKKKRLLSEQKEINSKIDNWLKEQTLKLETEIKEYQQLNEQLLVEKSRLQDDENKKIEEIKQKKNEKEKEIAEELEVLENEVKNNVTKYKDDINTQKNQLQNEKNKELEGKGVDINVIKELEAKINRIHSELDKIKEENKIVNTYNVHKEELLDREPKQLTYKEDNIRKQNELEREYTLVKNNILQKIRETDALITELSNKISTIEKGLKDYSELMEDDSWKKMIKTFELEPTPTQKQCSDLVLELRRKNNKNQKLSEDLKRTIKEFVSNFSLNNTFKFKTNPQTDSDFEQFANNLYEFVQNDKISEYRKRISERYSSIIIRISKEVNEIRKKKGQIDKVISEINRDFVDNNFTGVIKMIELRSNKSSNRMMQLLDELANFGFENIDNLGALNLFSTTTNNNYINEKSIKYLMDFTNLLCQETEKGKLSLSDTFNLEFRIKENDNDTGWIEKVSNVGSDGTDILVKAMVNIMLINVFKKEATKKTGEFKLHCMMDEIGKLHPSNIKGILQFANARNILLINSSPTSFDPKAYRHTYMLTKDRETSLTKIIPITTTLR